MAVITDHIEIKSVGRPFPFYNNCNKECKLTLLTSAHVLFLYVDEGHGVCVAFCYNNSIESVESLNGSFHSVSAPYS